MGILCRLFGHRADNRGWWGDSLYGKIEFGPVDGIGRTHFSVTKDCERCGERMVQARFHGSEELRDHLLKWHPIKDKDTD